MGRGWMGLIMLLGGWAVAQTLVSAPAQAQLDPYYYADTCPNLTAIVAQNLLPAIANDSRVPAGLLRIHFHDCFVLGCDASVLLAGDASEKLVAPNRGSLYPPAFTTIDIIKGAVEAECPNVVSCADITALASFFSVIFSGGPIWVIPLGRRDGLVPTDNVTTIASLPPPSSTLTNLTAIFAAHNLSLTDLVALSGGHTIGDSRCASFFNSAGPVNDDRLYNWNGSGGPDPQLNSSLVTVLKNICPNNVNYTNVTTVMDNKTPRTFDNSYFKNFLTSEQLFISDNSLYNDNTGNANETTARAFTRQLVLNYIANQSLFFEDFAQSMINMGNLNVSTGTAGEIRLNCSVPNPTSSSTTATVQPSTRESKPEKVSKELSQEEKDKFIDDIVEVVKSVRLEYLGKHLERLVQDGVIDSLHSSF